MPRHQPPFFSAALWASPFRPFFLLALAYGPLLIAAWLAILHGLWPPTALPAGLWHGHEMIFGFAMAVIVGIALTALPGWAGTPEIHGRRLAVLVALWLAGRAAFHLAPHLPAHLPAVIDNLLLPVLITFLTPQLLRATNPLYLLLLPILAALGAANIAFYAGHSGADPARAASALHAALYAIIVLFVLKGGVLTQVFTGNALRARGRGTQASFRRGLETVATAAVVALAIADLGGAPRALSGGLALFCALVHAWRTARWQGWRVIDEPLVLLMQFGFLWLILAFALKAAADLGGIVPANTWIHAFTVGALGMMMLSLMTRVGLRHTGRPLALPASLRAAALLMLAAALLRQAVDVAGLGLRPVTLAALLWGVTILVPLCRFGPLLLRPSLPRAAPRGAATAARPPSGG
ncbi:NnrS family protein [Thauera aromatica]|nr:NnrS family protein [Thauera aromatica]MCK2126604.1 NnrS family protein [Thauera aromatica]